MNIRLAVGSALTVFLLSVALIISIGLAQPAGGTTIQAAPANSSSDLTQVKRYMLTTTPNDTIAPPQPSEPQNVTEPQPPPMHIRYMPVTKAS